MSDDQPLSCSHRRLLLALEKDILSAQSLPSLPQPILVDALFHEQNIATQPLVRCTRSQNLPPPSRISDEQSPPETIAAASLLSTTRKLVAIKVTGYRFISMLALIGFGLGKYFTNADGQSVLSNGLDFGYGVGVGVILLLLSYWREDRGEGYGQWLFEKDWGYPMLTGFLSIAIVIVAVVLGSAVFAGVAVSIVGESGIISLVRSCLTAVVLWLSTRFAYILTCLILDTSQFWFNFMRPRFIRGVVRRMIYRTLIAIPIIGIFVVGFVSTTIALGTVFSSPQERRGHILTYLQYGFQFCLGHGTILAIQIITTAIDFAGTRVLR